jgi:hypothetical protein
MAQPRLTATSPRYVSGIERADFLARFWDYKPGEHTTIIGHTGSGKTYLSFQLLGATINHSLPGIVLVMKPRDSTVTSWAKKLNLKRVSAWPPSLAQRKYEPPNGWVLWPKLGDFERDNDVLRTQFHHCFSESYSQAAGKNPEPRIIFADEVVGISTDLRKKKPTDPDLPEDLDNIWQRGRSLEVALWAATQRPFYAPQLAFSQCTHLFVHQEPDQRNRDRIGELSGFDSAFVRTIIDPSAGVMKKHQFLYMNRDTQRMAIIGR